MQVYFIYPGWNPTILVDNLEKEILISDYSDIANNFLKSYKEFEQVGFIEFTNNWNYKCYMMWWELCINALRSLWFWIYDKFSKTEFELESSWTSEKFKINIETWVSVSLSKKYNIEKLENNLVLVKLDGIYHFVKRIKGKTWNRSKSEINFQKIQKKYINLLSNIPAIWLIWVDESNRIYPLVFVKDTNSLFFESACWSWTLAVFIASNKINNCFIQPSKSYFLVEENKDNFVLKSMVKKLT